MRSFGTVALAFGLLLLVADAARSQQCDLDQVSAFSPRGPWYITVNGVERSHHDRENTARRAARDTLRKYALASVYVEIGILAHFDARPSAGCNLPPPPEPAPEPEPPAPEPEPAPLDSVVVLPDELDLQIDETYQLSAVIWLDELPYVCIDEGVIEAKIAEDRSQACAISGGARLDNCLTPQPALRIERSEPCPSVGS